ncbi:hypothetical protein KFE25_002474 [Diacronema lutheri]|uniref:Uncharacterized protein n=1 Tax=Diacronema lutheri TaxID=2081491 RepID=A0A8J6C1R3_DIALT|nr:hypothetical protein KFE25_002474 [Diacronema lutheri]
MAVVVTVAGSYRLGGEDGPGEVASFNSPSELLCLPDGSLLVADTAGDRIRRVCRLPGGDGAPLPAGASVETISAKGWLRPMGMALLRDGGVLVCDHGHNRVRRLSPDLRTVSVYAGCGLRGSRDGPAHAAQFAGPRGVCVWQDVVLITDGHSVRAIWRAPGGGLHVSTVAGGPHEGYSDGPGASARFCRPGALLPFSGSVLLCDTGNHCVRHLLLARAESSALGVPTVSVLTLCGRAMAGSADGDLRDAQLSAPSGIAPLSLTELLIADSGNNALRKLSLQHEAVATVAGSLERKWGVRDGSADVALLNLPRGLALGAGGCIFIADSANNCVRAVLPAPARARTPVPRVADAAARGAHGRARAAVARSPSPQKRAGSPRAPQPVTASSLGLPLAAAPRDDAHVRADGGARAACGAAVADETSVPARGASKRRARAQPARATSQHTSAAALLRGAADQLRALGGVEWDAQPVSDDTADAKNSVNARLSSAEQLLLSVSGDQMSAREELARLCGVLEGRVHRLEAQLRSAGIADSESTGVEGARGAVGDVGCYTHHPPRARSAWSHDPHDAA